MKRIINDKPEIKPIKNKLKKVFKKSINTLRNFSLLIIIFQTIVILSIAISEPVALRIILGKLSRRILWSFDTLEIKDYGNYLKDFLIVLNPLSRELDRVDININFKNLQGLDCSREFNSYSTTNKIEETIKKCGNYWFNGSLSHGNKNYKVKIRSKGDRDIHYRSFDNMSFKVDIKGEDRLKGMEEFAIQTPMIRNYTIIVVDV